MALKFQQLVTVRENGTKRVQTINEEDSKTRQSEFHRADLKSILAKYEQTGVLVNMRQVDLAYRDVSEFTDFTDLMQQAKNAEKAFLRLPAEVRKVFNHDVAAWLDAAHDPEKLEAVRPQLEKLGVLDAVAGPEEPAEPSPEEEPPEPS